MHGNRELVIHLNCRSLLPKVDELRAVFHLSKPLFIAATEAWLNNNVPDTEVNINEYCIERNDRNSRGGGVALYVKNGMKYERKLQLEDPDNETICIEVKLRRNLPCLTICVYRAPDKPIAPFIDYLEDVTREVLRSGKQIVIVGDLNCDYLNNSSPQTKALKLKNNYRQLKKALKLKNNYRQLKKALKLKNNYRQLKNNYRPVSLLPSLSKICEKIVFARLYDFLLDIGFLYKYQSGFRPGDSTINQLIYIIHQIYLAFESGKEVRVVFLDISKAFDKVWHAGLLKKLEALGKRPFIVMDRKLSF